MKPTLTFSAVITCLLLVGACAPRAAAPPAQTATDATPTLSPRQQNAPLPTASASDVVDARLNQEFLLGVGQTGIATDSPDQFGITFFGVKQDSRCPQGAQCIVAGEVVAMISFQENGLMHPPIFEITSNLRDPKNKIAIEGYLVELLGVQPPRQQNTEIAPEDYIGTFRISPAPKQAPTQASGAQPTVDPMATPAAQFTGALDEPIVVKMFRPVEIPAAQCATMNGVLEDSRCPKQVDCIQAGRAVMSFMLERSDQIGYVVLSTQPPDGQTQGYFQGYGIELTDVQPYPETPDQNIRTADYSATIIVREAEPPTTVNKNQGFVLKPGQTAAIEDENVKVTFERVESDSRCPYMVTCAVRGNAVVRVKLTQADGTEQTFVLNTDSGKSNERIPDTGRYGMELVVLNPYPQVDSPSPAEMQDEYEATLVLRRFATDVQPKTPPANPVACLGLTAQDAESILGEPVDQQPRSDVLLMAEPFDDDSRRETEGICGFTSIASDDGKVFTAGEPRTSGGTAQHAVAAARLNGAQALDLLRVANIVRGSDPEGDSTSLLILLTRLTAGDWEGTFETFQELPHDTTRVQFESVDSFGDEGLWIWRDAQANNYAALLVREKNSFVLIEALTANNIGEAAAQESLHTAMAKIIS